MPEVVTEALASPAASAGLQFIWAISFGQILTFALTSVAAIFGFGKIIGMVVSTRKDVTALQAEFVALRTSLDRLSTAIIASNRRDHIQTFAYKADEKVNGENDD